LALALLLQEICGHLSSPSVPDFSLYVKSVLCQRLIRNAGSRMAVTSALEAPHCFMHRACFPDGPQVVSIGCPAFPWPAFPCLSTPASIGRVDPLSKPNAMRLGSQDASHQARADRFRALFGLRLIIGAQPGKARGQAAIAARP